jgi:transducin (beta)-like 1
MEGHLERSPYGSKHIPRGELVELLSKSLLYLEVESHWRGDALTSNCKSGFSLLEPHICSLESPKKITQLPTTPHISINIAEPKINGTIIEPNGKRKSSPVIIEGPTEKRAKRDQEDMDIDSSSECMVSRILLILSLCQSTSFSVEIESQLHRSRQTTKHIAGIDS